MLELGCVLEVTRCCEGICTHSSEVAVTMLERHEFSYLSSSM